MYDSFSAALRVVVPMVILMAAGYLVRVGGTITRKAMRDYDKVIFRLFMPVMLFKNIYEIDLSQGIAWRDMVFASVCLLVIFAFALKIPRMLTNDGKKYSVIGQAVLRCNYILFGVAVSEALYGEGNSGAVVMLGVLVIPAINILSPVIIEAGTSGHSSAGKLFAAVLKNPMIIGALLGLAFKALGVNIPPLIWQVIRSISNSTTTISFISLGVGLDMASAVSDRKLLLWGIFLRMCIIPLVFMPLSVLAGFRGGSLCAMMVVFAAPTAVASYPMAVAMGADGDLAGQLVCMTTLLSVITIFLWTFVLRSMGLL